MNPARQFSTATCLILCVGAFSGLRADEGKVLREKIRGPSLENNAAGESAERWVSVYLPPGYAGRLASPSSCRGKFTSPSHKLGETTAPNRRVTNH